MIQRNITKELLALLKNFPVVGILGPRQSGKTTLAKFIISKLKKKCLYFDLEDIRDSKQLKDHILVFEENIDKCIIIDEVQRMQKLFESMRSFVDMKRVPARFIVLGSASPVLLKKTSESLAGRIAYLELSPFNLLEVENIKKLEEHWFFGGYPKVILEKKKNMINVWFKNFIRTYIERDLPGIGFDSDSELLLKFWTFLSGDQGGLFNATNYSKILGITQKTVNRYLHYLQYSYMIHKLYPFHYKINKRLVKAPKIYIRDSGILHYLTEFSSFSELQRKSFIGQSFEGYAIEQIRQLKNDYTNLYFYRTYEGTECDLVFVKGLMPIAVVEIKYSSAPDITKSLKTAIHDLKTETNFIITPYSEDYPVAKNIRVCNLKDFLKKHLPKIK